MTKYLRVRPPEFMDRSQANALEILDLYSIIIKESQNENQIRNISVKDVYLFDQIFKPTVSNIELYGAIIQYNIDKFIELQPQRIILRGEQKSGRTYTLVGMPQDPGLLLIFTGHLFYKLEELKKKETNSNYELRYNYKIFLKCYIKEENQKTYDLLSNSTESMVNHESVISFDNQLQFLKLLRVILRNVDQRNFRDPKQYHQFQQTQSRFNLRESTFDFILERQSTNWNGQQQFQKTNFKFEITEMKSPLHYFQGDILIYFVNPATKFIAQTKNLLKEASQVKIQKGIPQISEEIVKNQFNFVIKSMKQFDTKEHIEQMQILMIQFKKEIEKMNEILDIKQEIVEKVQILLKVDLNLMAKLIYSTDVREFLMSKFQLYQVTESFNELKEVREQIDVLYRRLKRLFRQKSKILQSKQNEQQEDFKYKLISDIKRNVQAITLYLKQLITQEQYRGHNYEKLKNQIFTQFIEPLPELIVPEPDSPKKEEEQTILPKISKTRRLTKNYQQKQISLNDSLVNEKGNIYISLHSSKRNQESSIFSSSRIKTDKSTYPKIQHQQNTKNHNILKYPYTLDIDIDDIQQNEQKYSFSKPQDYKKLNSNIRVFRNNERILETMSQLDKFVVQSNIITSTDIIRDFQNKTKFASEIKKFKIPNLSKQYIQGIEKVNELNFNTIKF